MRAAILSAVQDQPGIHFRGLQREVGCSTSTVRHHVDNGPVQDADIRGYRRIYPDDVEESLFSPLAALNHDSRGPILTVLHDDPGLRFGRVVDRVDRSAATVSQHLQVLAAAELVTVEDRGRATHYRPTPVTEQAIRAHQSLLDRWTDGFIALWD